MKNDYTDVLTDIEVVGGDEKEERKVKKVQMNKNAEC